MGIEENKASFKRIYEEIFNNRDFSVIPELVSPDYYLKTPLGEEYKGHEGYKQHLVNRQKIFPDYHFTVGDVFGEGDTVIAHVTWTATFKGKIGKIDATGKRVKVDMAVFSYFKDGKEIGGIAYSDRLNLYQQLGVLPPTKEIGK